MRWMQALKPDLKPDLYRRESMFIPGLIEFFTPS
jgi:hypothetical protein